MTDDPFAPQPPQDLLRRNTATDAVLTKALLLYCKLCSLNVCLALLAFTKNAASSFVLAALKKHHGLLLKGSDLCGLLTHGFDTLTINSASNSQNELRVFLDYEQRLRDAYARLQDPDARGRLREDSVR